ncbi:MAG: PDDEXK nuclease domain-containing protein [Coriobacteriales bacterium]|nr:PDDEXK nuclease domain-containing protein [Coriobacteriales bacterium]
MDKGIDITLMADLRALIDRSRERAALAINYEMSSLYWHVGRRINSDVLQHRRAEYGKQTLPRISKALSNEFGSGWSTPHLRHCMKFASAFPNEAIVSTLWKQLGWSQLKVLMHVDEPIKRDFYVEMAKVERWTVKTLRSRINSMLFERTAISKKPEETIAQDIALLKDEGKMTPDMVFRDPYFLDYLGLQDTFSEKDLEDAILIEIQRFITDLGSDFGFLSRQKRMTVDGRDYYLDLLFTHRRLRCLIAVELKIGEFETAFKSQMELYLRWLEKYEMLEGENPPIGLILCTGKNSEHIELMRLDESNIRVAEYLTKLPDIKLLEAKLRQSVEIARSRIDSTLPNAGLLENEK